MTKTTFIISDEHLKGVTFDGAWKRSTKTQDTVEPATGRTLGQIGMVNADDIRAAAAAARKVQAGWAATNYERRAEILRNAARTAEDNRDEIIDWLVRESGSTIPKAAFELAVTIKALYEASAMPSQAAGRCYRRGLAISILHAAGR